jgi:hypothetical protein
VCVSEETSKKRWGLYVVQGEGGGVRAKCKYKCAQMKPNEMEMPTDRFCASAPSGTCHREQGEDKKKKKKDGEEEEVGRLARLCCEKSTSVDRINYENNYGLNRIIEMIVIKVCTIRSDLQNWKI